MYHQRGCKSYRVLLLGFSWIEIFVKNRFQIDAAISCSDWLPLERHRGSIKMNANMSHRNFNPILSILEINETVLSIKRAAKIKSTGPSSMFPKIERFISFKIVFDLVTLKMRIYDDSPQNNSCHFYG